MFNASCQSGEPIPDCTALSKVMPASTVESQCHMCRHLPVPSFTFVSICMTSTVANNTVRGKHRWLNRDQPELSACEPCWQVSCSPFCTAVLNNIQRFAIQAFVLGCCCCRDSAAGSLLCLLASSTHGRSYVQAVLPVCKRVRGGLIIALPPTSWLFSLKTPVRSRRGLAPKPAPVMSHRTFLEGWWPGWKCAVYKPRLAELW